MGKEPSQKEIEEHSIRFRRVGSGYAHAVALAYDGDLAAAARATNEEVAAKVREWEVAHGIEPRDWVAIGRDERDENE